MLCLKCDHIIQTLKSLNQLLLYAGCVIGDFSSSSSLLLSQLPLAVLLAWLLSDLGHLLSSSFVCLCVAWKVRKNIM